MHHRTLARAANIVAFSIASFACAVPALSQQTAPLRGVVTDPDGEPIADVTVQVEGTRLVTDTGPEGAFSFEAMRPGRHVLRFDRLGYAPRTETVRVRAGRETRVDVALDPRPILMEGLAVIGTPEELAEVRQRMAEVPGGIDLIESAELRRTRQTNFKDVLRFTPGVWVQPRFGAADESQLSIRGSGLRNNFHLRGVNVLVNGMPYRNADGFTDFESLELLTVDNIQVYKGGNALRFGGSTLGGAINLETKTGYTGEKARLFAQGGSNGFLKSQVSTGQTFGDLDYYVSYANTLLDGHRQHMDQQRDRVNAHVGWVASPRFDLRGFYFFAYVQEDLPGSLTAGEFAADPGAADPNNVENRWGRDYTLHHVGIQARTQLTPNQRLDVSPYFQFRDIVHPIFRVLDQVSRDWGVEARYENTAPFGDRDNRLTIGFQPAWGNVDNLHFENVGGDRGDLAKDQEEDAGSVAVYAEDVLALTPRLSAVLGFRYDYAWRDVDDDFLDDGDQTDDRSFDAFMPKLGVLYDLPTVDGQIFANVSRSFEPPLLLELNSLTLPGFIDLDAQTAWQFEVGTRGRAAGWEWQVSAYDIELEDEILNINVRPFPDAPFTVPTFRNSPETRHYGLEAGLGWSPDTPVFTDREGGDRIGVRGSYTLSRFEYLDDPEFGDNDIPGAPTHALNLEFEYAHPSGISLRPSLEWVPDDYFVDSANTVENDGWAVLNLRGEWEWPSLGASLFVEGRNLTDETYSPAVVVDNAAGRFFQPADGASFNAGLRWHR